MHIFDILNFYSSFCALSWLCNNEVETRVLLIRGFLVNLISGVLLGSFQIYGTWTYLVNIDEQWIGIFPTVGIILTNLCIAYFYYIAMFYKKLADRVDGIDDDDDTK